MNRKIMSLQHGPIEMGLLFFFQIVLCRSLVVEVVVLVKHFDLQLCKKTKRKQGVELS